MTTRHATAGLLLAVNDGPVHRCRTTIFWQQREVNVDATVPGRAEKFRRKNLSVSHDDSNVSLVRCEQLLGFVIPDFLRLMNGEVVFRSECFRGRLMDLFSATRWLIGLRPNRDYLVAVIDEPPERRHGRFRGAHENDAHSTTRRTKAKKSRQD